MSQKELIITDCILSTPEILSKSYSKEQIEKSYVDTGMLDSEMKSCPDLYGIMKYFYINWRNINGGKKWFDSKLVYTLIEMFDHGCIVEKIYDDHLFPIDYYVEGQV